MARGQLHRHIVVDSAPRFATAAPRPRKTFAHELVADIAPVDRKGSQCATVTVRALSMNLHPLAVENVGQPTL